MFVYESGRPRRGGGGLLNRAINSLPIEIHIPGYRYCGPGTKLTERLSRGDAPINKLDEACLEHDVAYSQSRDLKRRHEADRLLGARAWKRVKSSDAGVGERTAALAVAGAMKAKTKLGMGGSKNC